MGEYGKMQKRQGGRVEKAKAAGDIFKGLWREAAAGEKIILLTF